jgi:hypothetical protein
MQDDIRDWTSAASNLLVAVGSRLPDVVRPYTQYFFVRLSLFRCGDKLGLWIMKHYFSPLDESVAAVVHLVDVGFGMHDLSMSHVNKQTCVWIMSYS